MNWPWFIAVSDGVSIRTIHPPALPEAARTYITQAITEALVPPQPKLPVVIKEPPKAKDMMTQGEMAKVQGYTGNVCVSCGEFRMKRTGTCETCEACGTPGGGCS